MAEEDSWWWWAGDAEGVDSEGLYTHGECATREAVIAEILPDLEEGDVFCVVEAQFGDEDDGNDDRIPFKASRNQEFLMKLEDRAVPAPAADAAPLNDTYLSGKPYYCATCGLGMPEYNACEDGGCKLETVEKAEKRLRIAQAKVEPRVVCEKEA